MLLICHYMIVFFSNCGLLTILSDEEITKVANALDAISKNYEVLDSSEIGSRFSGINSLGHTGVYEKSGGVLKSNKCLEALHVISKISIIIIHMQTSWLAWCLKSSLSAWEVWGLIPSQTNHSVAHDLPALQRFFGAVLPKC